ncbi:DUF2207 domain-containing protein, partial [Mycolicibacterium vinylchloridicum]|uniref:DUF2207 domain-containing protein n=1 Tax=Mycolicibacterium vinylchloridicum TaxID=2736928 RepID=UPI0015CAA344
MKTTGRVIGTSITLLLITIGLLWPLVFTGSSQGSPPSDPVVITDYHAEFVVDANGRLDATEIITGEFPSGRHGIFRYWDVANLNSPHVRQEPRITEILLDDRPVPYTMKWESGKRFRIAKIGDPNQYLDYGTHVFRIRYTLDGVLDPGGTGADKKFASSTGDPSARSTFFWNVIAPAWNNTIEHADIFITLPGGVSGAQCSVGYGVGRACDDLTVNGDTVQLSASNLDPRTPVTVRAGVDVPTPPRTELPWTYRWDTVLGRSLPAMLWLVGATVAAGLGAYLWWRTTVEPSPGFPLQYAPPPGLGPVQCEYIRTEKVPGNGLTATLFYLAERKLIDLHQVSGKKWSITGTAEYPAWADIDRVSLDVASALKIVGPGARFDANGTVTAGKKLSRAKTDMNASVRKWAFDGFMVKRSKELWLRLANFLALVLAVCGFLGWGFPFTLWGVPFAVFFGFSARSWTDGVGSRRTPAGRELWSQAGGFYRMLSTDSAESRFDFAARKDLYTAYIPFAVAGGVAALWASKYQTATGEVDPQPDWYHSSSGTGWHAASTGGASFDSFESALSSSIGAYTASQSSSSSSSGGSSGGGGGGG